MSFPVFRHAHFHHPIHPVTVVPLLQILQEQGSRMWNNCFISSGAAVTGQNNTHHITSRENCQAAWQPIWNGCSVLFWINWHLFVPAQLYRTVVSWHRRIDLIRFVWKVGICMSLVSWAKRSSITPGPIMFTQGLLSTFTKYCYRVINNNLTVFYVRKLNLVV